EFLPAGDTDLRVHPAGGNDVEEGVDAQGGDEDLPRAPPRATSLAEAIELMTPVGRSSSTAARMIKAEMSLNCGLMKPAATSATTPMMIEPTIAPEAEPIPPRTAAAMMRMKKSLPVLELSTCTSMTRTTPASPQSTPESSQVPSTTALTGMPQ